MTPTELLELIRQGCTTKDLIKEDIPVLVTLFEQDLVIIDEIKNGYCILIEKK